MVSQSCLVRSTAVVLERVTLSLFCVHSDPVVRGPCGKSRPVLPLAWQAGHWEADSVTPIMGHLEATGKQTLQPPSWDTGKETL